MSGPPPLDWGVGNYERTAQMLLPAAQELVGHAALTAGERVLDVGCGTGNAALLAAAAGAVVTALDPSPRLLEVAATTAREQGLELDCRQGHAGAVPAADGSFDCVLSNFGLIFSPEPEATAAELARVVAPGGRVLLTSWLPEGAVSAFAGAAQDEVRAALGVPPPPPSPVAWHEEASVHALVAPHGLVASRLAVHELAFTDTSPEAFLEAELANHPMAITGYQVLQGTGQAEAARERLLRILTEQNEDANAFRGTSRYAVIRIARG